jgi:hypothetical protein
VSEKMHIQCYKCKAVYELEYELSGQLVECAVCNAVFEVPQLDEKYKAKTTETNIDAENEEQTPVEGKNPNLETAMGIESTLVESNTTKLSTKTIRLPRARCGMLPEVDDKFGTEQARNPLYHKKEPSASKETLEDFTKSQTKPVKKAPKAASKWWPWGNKKK